MKNETKRRERQTKRKDRQRRARTAPVMECAVNSLGETDLYRGTDGQVTMRLGKRANVLAISTTFKRRQELELLEELGRLTPYDARELARIRRS